jgi:hypothetical protein
MRQSGVVMIVALFALMPGCAHDPVSPQGGVAVTPKGAVQTFHFDEVVADPANQDVRYRVAGDVSYILTTNLASPFNTVDISLSLSGLLWDARTNSPIGEKVEGKISRSLALRSDSPSTFVGSFPVQQSDIRLLLVVEFSTDGNMLAIQKLSLSEQAIGG